MEILTVDWRVLRDFTILTLRQFLLLGPEKFRLFYSLHLTQGPSSLPFPPQNISWERTEGGTTTLKSRPRPYLLSSLGLRDRGQGNFERFLETLPKTSGARRHPLSKRPLSERPLSKRPLSSVTIVN